MKKYRVELTDEERASLQRLIRRGRRGQTSARKLVRARILLLADAGASDTEIVAALSVGLKTVEQMRRRFNESRLGALDERPRTGRPRGRVSRSAPRREPAKPHRRG
jgi:Winged helix-turn helix